MLENSHCTSAFWITKEKKNIGIFLVCIARREPPTNVVHNDIVVLYLLVLPIIIYSQLFFKKDTCHVIIHCKQFSNLTDKLTRNAPAAMTTMQHKRIDGSFTKRAIFKLCNDKIIIIIILGSDSFVTNAHGVVVRAYKHEKGKFRKRFGQIDDPCWKIRSRI